MLIQTPQPTNTQDTISLITRTEINQVDYKIQKTIIGMCSLKAPIDPNRRAPIDIVCVIDRSSSMAGDKIDLLCKTLTFAVEQLGDADSMALVTYDSAVNVAFELLKMDQVNKEKAKKIIQSIKAGSTTNLSGGLLMGLDFAVKRPLPCNDVCSVLLFTDGLANVGITSLDTIVLATQRKLALARQGCTVFTFGFGEDHDPNMMQSIATAGNGMYYFIQSEDQIPLSFASCIGGLQSVYAQNMKLTLETNFEGVKINKVHNTLYQKNVKEIEPGKKIVIPLGDIYMEESRDILISLSLPSLIEPLSSACTICKVTLDYFNVLQTMDETVTSEIKIERPFNLTSTSNDEEIEKQKDRLLVADALEKGRLLAEKQKFEEAQQVIQEATKDIKSRVRFVDNLDDYTRHLAQDLDEATNIVSSKANYFANKMKMYSKSASHQVQRNVDASEEVTYYETSEKMSRKKDWSAKMK